MSISLKATPEWPYHVSSGGVVFREKEGAREYLVLFRGERFKHSANSYHLPKGTVDGDETLEAAGLREVVEEAGVTVEPVAYLGAITREWVLPSTGFLCNKTVHYYLYRYLEETDHGMDKEHDSVHWLPFAEAVARLQEAPKQEGEILKRAEAWFFLDDRLQEIAE